MIKGCLKAIFIHQEGTNCSAVRGATEILDGSFGDDRGMQRLILEQIRWLRINHLLGTDKPYVSGSPADLENRRERE